MADEAAFKYAVLDGDAVLIGEHEAWTYLGGKWREISHADAFTKAALIDQPTFDRMFGNILAAIPPEAFADD